jgi:hypothetical protein
MVRRDAEGELEYYRISGPYVKDHYFRKDGTQSKIRKWEEVQEEWQAQAVEVYHFKSKTEVFNAVYQRGKRTEAAVWLEETVKTDGLSNNFSKVYRYLINSKLINNKSLKEALIIADNRENDGVSFSQKNKKDIQDLVRLKEEIKVIKGIQSEFEAFREVVNLFRAKTMVISDLVFAFNSKYQKTISDLDSQRLEKEKGFHNLVLALNEKLKPRQEELNREIGKRETEIEMKENHLIHLQRNLEELNGIEEQAFLLESLNNLNERRRQAESRITLVENQKLSSKQIEQRMVRLDNDINRLQTQIENYDHQLIHNISGDQRTRELLNFIFSDEFSSLSNELVKKKVTKTGTSLKIFDGEIELPKKLPVREIPSIDALRITLKELTTERSEQEKLLEVLLDFEKARRDLDGINADIDIIKLKINKLKEKPALENTVSELSKEVRGLKNQKEKLEEELEKLKEEITSKSIYLDTVREDARKLEERIEELKLRKAEIELLGISPTEFESNDSLEEIYEKIRVANHDRESLKVSKDRTFDQLRYKTNSAMADELEFVKYIEEEIACIAEKERSIDALLQSISTQFANPAHNLRRRYLDFKEYVYHSFNESLAKTKISDIESLRIELVESRRVMHDLERIASIQNMTAQLAFEFDKTEDLEILNRYLDQGKKINFEDLFDIELHLNLRGHTKKVDLKEQVESDGTDRMIRLVIIMAIINRLAISSESNRTVLFIDEIGTIDEQNRPELVNFCREHHFLPIFAAPQAYDGFSKYYFIFRSKGKIALNDDQHSVKREALA